MELHLQYTQNDLFYFYKQMLRIRFFEEAVLDAVKKDLFHGTTHLCIGQEATAVGACAALSATDKITSTHRGHGHSIAKGANLQKMMAEIFGKATGYSKGKGGSLHIADVSTGHLGSNGIVAAGIPIAVGSALRSQMTNADDVTLSFFGDGATNEGAFHEALNIAAIWKLPVVFFCENNQYGMSSHIDEMVAIKRLSSRADAYGFPGITIDGNNLFEVIETTKKAVEYARSGKGPFFIEAETYRLNGHSKSDKEKYRTTEEVDLWYRKDPIMRYEQYLYQKNIMNKKQAKEINQNITQEVEEALRFAIESPKPVESELYKDVYA